MVAIFVGHSHQNYRPMLSDIAPTTRLSITFKEFTKIQFKLPFCHVGATYLLTMGKLRKTERRHVHTTNGPPINLPTTCHAATVASCFAYTNSVVRFHRAKRRSFGLDNTTRPNIVAVRCIKIEYSAAGSAISKLPSRLMATNKGRVVFLTQD